MSSVDFPLIRSAAACGFVLRMHASSGRPLGARIQNSGDHVWIFFSLSLLGDTPSHLFSRTETGHKDHRVDVNKFAMGNVLEALNSHL